MLVDFDVFGETEVAAEIDAMALRAADMRPVFTRIREVLIAGNVKQFASQGAYFGQPWPPLAAATRERKQAGAVLQRTGALRASLTGGKGRSTSVSRTGVTVGTRDWKAHFHQGGTNKMPARQVVGFAPGQGKAAIWLIRRYLTQGIA